MEANSDRIITSTGETKSPCLDKHILQFQPASDSICIFGALEHFKIGGFYEIDHSQLPPNSPIQIKCVSVVMVSDKEEHQVSLRYPSLHSLRTHFSDQNFDKPSGKKIPALDEKYAMGLEFAIKALCRSIPTEEFAQKRNSWSFWVSPSTENIKNIDNLVIGCDASTSLVSKQGSCWSQLKFTGMMQWGQRRQVRFLGRHEYQKVEPLPELFKGKGVIAEHREATNEKKRKKFDEEEKYRDVKVASCAMTRMTRQCKMSHQNVGSSSGVKNSKKVMTDTKRLKLMVSSKNKRKITIDRWCIDRYKLAEENMLKVMKEKEAVFANPILRPDLRTEARKYIGDTGLLDHLLKHMAGKVAPGGAERFRRRHNAEGAMEYWLESADLVDIRKEAGVQDPYWTPPPGWKPGDSTSPDHVNSRELREMKEEILKLKNDMQELKSKKEEEALAIVTTQSTPSSCLSSLNSEDYVSLVSKQEIYAELVTKKAKIEEQLKEICLSLSGMEEQMRMLKPTLVGEELIVSESITPQALLPPGGPKSSLGENIGEEETKEKEKRNDNKATKAAEDKAAKIERLKSSFIICKPQGSFMWPNITLSPHVVANFEEKTVVPTPSSASSSTTSATKSQIQKLLLLPPNPSSPPVKPQAERRPVSTATLTTIVTGPFSPHLSQPSGTPISTVSDTRPNNGSSINLNDSPLSLQ